jgi:hypothetical protein
VQPSQIRCVYCKDPVDPEDKSVYRRVEGWERRPLASSRRGGSDVVCREHVVDVFACWLCVDRLRAGVSPQQETLL